MTAETATRLPRITLSVIRLILSFADAGTKDVFDGRRTKRALQRCSPELWDVARRKLDHLNQARAIDDLRRPPGNRLEKLKGDRSGQYSIRINARYRICFGWTDFGPAQVEITDYH